MLLFHSIMGVHDENWGAESESLSVMAKTNKVEGPYWKANQVLFLCCLKVQFCFL